MHDEDTQTDAERMADEMKDIHEQMLQIANQIRQLTEWLTAAVTDGKSGQ